MGSEWGCVKAQFIQLLGQLSELVASLPPGLAQTSYSMTVLSNRAKADAARLLKSWAQTWPMVTAGSFCSESKSHGQQASRLKETDSSPDG